MKFKANIRNYDSDELFIFELDKIDFDEIKKQWKNKVGTDLVIPRQLPDYPGQSLYPYLIDIKPE